MWSSCTFKNENSFKPKNSISLNSKEGQTLVYPYSRDDVDSVEGFWIVTDKEVELVENNFKKVTTLKPNYSKLSSLDTYAFQYIGVVRNGKKYIYINAFPAFYAERKDPFTRDWTKQPIKVHDGGNGFWGVLFDIEKQKFSNLSINGSA
jgi:hypothetical protein